MIGYITLGTNNIEKAAQFYDQLLASLGATRFMESVRLIAWAVSPEQPAFCVVKPYDGESASVGNGVMIALSVDSPDKVDALYQKALSLGATCEGEPGPRQLAGVYAAYFRDLDGDKLNVFNFAVTQS